MRDNSMPHLVGQQFTAGSESGILSLARDQESALYQLQGVECLFPLQICQSYPVCEDNLVVIYIIDLPKPVPDSSEGVTTFHK